MTSLEASLLRVPCEHLLYLIKSAQRDIEKELKQIYGGVATIRKRGDAITVEEARTKVSELKTKATRLQERLRALHETQRSVIGALRQRGQYLSAWQAAEAHAEASGDRTNDDTLSGYSSDKVMRLIVDSLMRQGFMEAAERLAVRANIVSLVDAEMLGSARTVVESLEVKQSCEEALRWCEANRSRLKKIGSTLEFELRLQQCVVVARRDGASKAVELARKRLVPFADEQKERLCLLMGFLVHADLRVLPQRYAELGDAPRRWTALARQFEHDFVSLFAMSEAPPLNVHILCGLAALKTRSCAPRAPISGSAAAEAVASAMETSDDDGGGDGGDDGDIGDEDNARNESERHAASGELRRKRTRHSRASSAASASNEMRGVAAIDCPVCVPALFESARDLPPAYHQTSCLVCFMTGDVMDANNPPRMLPNGMVYSERALMAMAERLNGRVECVRTGDTFAFVDTFKLYIV